MISMDRITSELHIMGGAPCIRGMPVTVNSIVGMMNCGTTAQEILADYPYLEAEDIRAAMSYEASRQSNTVALEGSCGLKPRPNHQRTLQILRSVEPAQKLAQVFKLNERTLHLFRTGVHHRFPDLNDSEFEKVYLQLRERCHNRNY